MLQCRLVVFWKKSAPYVHKSNQFNSSYEICVLACVINPLKPKLVYILFKISVRTSKRTPHFAITKINLLMLFKEIIAAYSENHAKDINTKFSVAACKSRWCIQLPLGLKGLSLHTVLCSEQFNLEVKVTAFSREHKQCKN
jgi:hypothetical protein